MSTDISLPPQYEIRQELGCGCVNTWTIYRWPLPPDEPQVTSVNLNCVPTACDTCAGTIKCPHRLAGLTLREATASLEDIDKLRERDTPKSKRPKRVSLLEEYGNQ